jgi:hypothetical protein
MATRVESEVPCNEGDVSVAARQSAFQAAVTSAALEEMIACECAEEQPGGTWSGSESGGESGKTRTTGIGRSYGHGIKVERDNTAPRRPILRKPPHLSMQPVFCCCDLKICCLCPYQRKCSH